MGRYIPHGSTDQSVFVRILTTTGLAKTDVTAATGNVAMLYVREGGNATSAGTVGNLASGDAAHSDAGLVHLTAGLYRADPPDAAFASGSDEVAIRITGDDLVCVPAIHPLGPVPADVTQWAGCTTFEQGGFPAVVLADSSAHGGSAASLEMDQITINSGTVLGNLTTSLFSTIAGNAANLVNVTLGNVAHGGSAASLTLASASVSGNVTAGNLATNVVGNLSGSVGSVTGAVGSVTGNVGGSVEGNVAGSVASVTGNVAAVTGNVGGSVLGNVTVNALTQGAIDDFFTVAASTDYGNATAGSLVLEIADNAGGSSLTVGDIADAVWDEALSGHTTPGSTGDALGDAGSAGDPWGTDIQAGGYSGNEAGAIVYANLNATISSRSTFDAGNDTVNVGALSGNATAADDLRTAIEAGLSTYDGSDTSGTTTLLSRLTSARAGYIDNLSAGAAALESTAQSILTDTAEIGAAGAGLTAAGGNGTHLTEAGGTGDQLTALSTLDAAGVRTAVGLASANLDTQLDALPTAAENATAILAAGDVDGFSLEETLKLCLASLAGKLSGAATTTITIRAADDSTNRIVATVDADGNRSAVTLTASG